MNAGKRHLLKKFARLVSQSRQIANRHISCVTYTCSYLGYRQQMPSTLCCFSTSRLCHNDDDNDKKGSTDISETEFFDRFYEAVAESAKSNSYALQRIQKAKLSEGDKKRAIKRWTFEQVVEIYIKQNPNRRRHVEFIYEALDRIISLGLGRDLEVYKKLLRAFPQDGRMNTSSEWMIEMKYFPKQQDCALELMDQMDENGVIPDNEFCTLVKNLFGPRSHPYRKLRRTRYWAQKFHNANPYQLPYDLPDDGIELAILALQKMVVDLQNEMQVWQTKEPEETYIVSAQSLDQRKLLKQHNLEKPIYVEGGFSIWLRDTSLTYFVLRGDSDPALFPESVTLDENDEVFDTEKPKEVMPSPSEHQQEDGTVLAMCITGSSSKQSLIQWVRLLQESNPTLEQTSIVFRLKSPVEAEDILAIEQSDPKNGDMEPV